MKNEYIKELMKEPGIPKKEEQNPKISIQPNKCMTQIYDIHDPVNDLQLILYVIDDVWIE